MHFANTVVSRKRAHGRYILLCAQTGGWADICNITTFQEKDSKFHAMSYVEKLIRNFQKLPR